jgi:hypothetical protein
VRRTPFGVCGSPSSKVVVFNNSGFALAAGRTVPAGGVGQMLHVARANLRNLPR